MVSLGALGPLKEGAQSLADSLLSGAKKESEHQTKEEQEEGFWNGHHRFIIDASGQPEWALALKAVFDLSSTQGDHLADRNVLILETSVPHTWLLPKCSAIIHHGGSGTTAAALRAGIAQVRICRWSYSSTYHIYQLINYNQHHLSFSLGDCTYDDGSICLGRTCGMVGPWATTSSCGSNFPFS